MSNVVEALFFPLKNSSLKMFIGLSLLFLLQIAVIWIPIISLLNIVFVGYIYATQFKIIFTTGNGYTDAPEFPDFGDFFDSILFPLLKMAFVWLFGFLPYILVIVLSDSPSDSLLWGLSALGAAYVPIGLMIVAMDEVTKAANPVVIFDAIRRAGWSYAVLVLTFAGFTIGEAILEDAFTGSWLLSSIVGAYGIMFTARLIGGVYRDHLADDSFESADTDY
jgi:hypothetical protein